MIKLFTRLFLLIILLFLASLVITKGIANYYADEAHREASFDDLEQAIKWNPKQSYALGQLAKHYSEKKNYSKVQDLAFRSLANNPTYGLPASLIIEVADQNNDEALATEAIDFTKRLWPSHTIARNEIVKHWLKKDRIDKILPEWNVILSQEPWLSSKLFPIMYQLSQNPASLILFKPYAKEPSRWWSSFFTYLARQKDNLDTLRKLYQVRLESKEPLSDSERRSYITRLFKEKQWNEAYFSWLSGLEKKYQHYALATLFDGGFESDLHDTGFDWFYSQNKIVSIRTERTRGIHGKSALHVFFKKRERINFHHVSQQLLLPSGYYSFKVRSRVDRLKTQKGLKWRIRCLGDQKTVLGESRSLLGSSPWKEDTFYFSVPESKNCQAQLLRLEASSPYAHNHLFLGGIWFDDIKIKREKKSKNTTKVKRENEK